MTKTDKDSMFACLWTLLANTAPNEYTKYLAIAIAVFYLLLAIFRKEQNQ